LLTIKTIDLHSLEIWAAVSIKLEKAYFVNFVDSISLRNTTILVWF